MVYSFDDEYVIKIRIDDWYEFDSNTNEFENFEELNNEEKKHFAKCYIFNSWEKEILINEFPILLMEKVDKTKEIFEIINKKD